MNNRQKTYVLSLDSRCNQRCLICMKKEAIALRRPLSFESVCKEIKEAARQGFKKIDFYGGEPLAYPFIARAVRLANGLSLSCFLATNATKFSSEIFTRSFFSGLKIKEIRTTLHGCRAGLHDRITRKKGSFKRAVRGIRNILRLRKSAVSVNVVVNVLNYPDLEKTADFVHSLGVRNITFSGLVAEGEILSHPSLFVDMAKIRPALGAGMRRSLRLRMGAKIIKLPVCILDEKLRHPRYCVYETNRNLIKLSGCVDCRHNGFCPGLDLYQIRAFGVPGFIEYV